MTHTKYTHKHTHTITQNDSHDVPHTITHTMPHTYKMTHAMTHKMFVSDTYEIPFKLNSILFVEWFMRCRIIGRLNGVEIPLLIEFFNLAYVHAVIKVNWEFDF